jgi:alpha-L-fucosidase
MPSGEVQPEFQQRLMEMGRWLERNGESLYGTRSGHNFFIYADSTLTTRDNKVYFHIFNWQQGAMLRMNFDSKKHVNRAYVLEDGSPIELIRNPAHGDAPPTSVSFVARNKGWSTADTVVVLETS